MTDRVIVLLDMDCFYCQVETKLDPTLAGQPMAVVQYNAWKGGGIIAVNYEARDCGVTRGMRGDDAKKHCPNIRLVQVPTHRDKADLTKYRDASKEVIEVLCEYSDCIERASIDEAYIDLTQSVNSIKLSNIEPHQLNNTYVVGYSTDKVNNEDERSNGTAEWLSDIYSDGQSDESSQRLATAASVVEQIRQQVFNKTGFTCSAGIAHNKILAKLSCGLHKPNRQTVLPHSSVHHLYSNLSVKKIRHLGGKLGDSVMEKLSVKTMAELLPFTEKQLQAKFDDKTGSWLYLMARGIDNEQVVSRLVPKSIGCCKRFPGKTSLRTKRDITYWLQQLTNELHERITQDQLMNKRKAELLTVSLTLSNHQHTTKSLPLSTYDRDRIYNVSYQTVRKITCNDSAETIWSPIFCMGLSASKFTDLPKSSAGIQNFFKSAPVQTKEVGSSKQSDSTNSHNLVKHSTDKFHHLSFLKETCDDVKSIGKFEESSTKFGKSSRKIKPSSCNFQNSDQTELEKFQDNLEEETSDKFVETADNHFNSKEESNSFFSKFFRCSNQILHNQCTESNHLDLYNSIDNPVYNQNNELEDSNSVTEGKVQKDSSNEMVNVSFENDKEHVKSTTVAGSNKQTSKNSLRSLFESHAIAKSEGTEHSNCKVINPTVSTSETESKPESTAKKKSNSIQNFFKNSEESVNPLDVFPDLNAIDDELLNSLPFSFRKKIIQLKESMEINVNSDIKESGSVNENPKKNIESFEMETKENSTGTCGNLFKFNEKSLNKSPIKGKRKKKARISPKDECKSSTESYFNVRPAKDISGEGLYESNLSKTDSKPSCSKLKDVRQGSTSSDILNCDTKLVLLGNVDVFNENSASITSSVNGFQSEHCCREIFEEKISKFPTELKDDNVDSNLNGLEVISESKDGRDVIKSVDQQLPLPNNDLAKSDKVVDQFRRDDIEKQNLITDRDLNFGISRSKAGDRSNVAKCQDNRLVRNSTVGNEEVLKINDSSEVDWECQDMFETSEVTSHYFQEKCNQCCQLIPSDQYASHLDFHLAEKIHQEINSSQLSTDVYQLTNRLTRPTNQSVSAPLQHQTKTVSSKNISATSKRKLNTKEKKVSDSKKFKTLKTFFGT